MLRDRKDLIYDFNGLKVEVLGDPHLGKRFTAGVPLARRGEREKMVWADFQDSLLLAQAEVHVCMGDLFDNFSVDDTTIVMAATFYKAAASRNSGTDYFVLMGNHDMSRDAERLSSFRVFKEIMEDIRNVHVIDESMAWSSRGKIFGFFPYHPFKTAEEVMKEFLNGNDILSGAHFDAIFGHWDLDSFGEMPHNMFPADLAGSITNQAFTGHIHLPDIRSYGPNGELELVVVGSMQPYSHSEDPEQKLYTSVTLPMLKTMDPALLRDKCVRLILAQGEEAPEGLDALQYITKKIDALEEDQDLEVVLEDFDFRQIIQSEMSLQGVTDPNVTVSILSEFDRLRTEQMQ